MDITTTPAEPIARCKVCGSDEIVAICHHCSAALCADHGTNGATGSREFRGLHLAKKGRGEDPTHCADCVHRVLSTGDMVVLLLISAVPAALAFALSTSVLVRAGGVVIVLGAALGLVVEWASQRQDEHLPRCPVVPAIENERIVETYRYSSVLSDGGTWVHQSLGADGVAEADLRFDPDDVRRVATFAGSGGGVEDLDRVDAGFVMVRLGYPAAVDGVNVSDDGDRFGAERITLESAEVPYLFSSAADRAGGGSGTGPASIHRWSKAYDVRLPDGPPRLPVQIFPAIAPGSDRRTLELHVRWTDTAGPADLAADRVVIGPWDRPPTSLQSLEIRVPLERLGGVLPLDGDPIVTAEPGASDASDGGVRRIRWERIDVAEGEAGKRLRVQFEHPIPPDITIGGRLAVLFDHSFAGVTDLAWFDAMGRPTSRARSDQQRSPAPAASVVDVAFDCSTAPLPHEERYLHLERSLELRPELLDAIRPDHGTAIEIASRLSEAGFSIARIGESAVSPAEWSVEENRLWELRGHYFAGTTPLRFQLRIVGADRRWGLGDTMEPAHVTSVTLGAQGEVDGPRTRALFDEQLRAIEEQTRAAIMWLAGPDSATGFAPGDGGGSTSARPAGLDVEPSVDGVSTAAVRAVPLEALESVRHQVPVPRRERQCSMCGLGVDHRPYSLCHHCGRVVCLDRCSVTVRRDPAFVRSVDRLDTTASHCETCAEERHQVSFQLHRLARSRAVARLRPGRRSS